MDEHWQCFCNSQKPMLLFDQSVARQVGLDFSKMHTPSSISLMITDLDSSKSWSSSSVHLKGVPGWRSWQNGSMRSVAAKAYEAWLISPNHKRTSAMLAGVGKLQIASRYFLHGHTLLGVISNPANSTVTAPNTNLSGLNIILLCPQRTSQLTTWKKLLLRSSAQRRVSSIHFVLLGTWETILLNCLSNHRRMLCNPGVLFCIVPTGL